MHPTIESLEPRQLCAAAVPTGTITGVVYNDLNRNGVRDTGEAQRKRSKPRHLRKWRRCLGQALQARRRPSFAG